MSNIEQQNGVRVYQNPRSPWRRFADGWRIGQDRIAARRAANPPKPPRPPRPESPVVWIALAALIFWR
jgi:hypothetical protein